MLYFCCKYLSFSIRYEKVDNLSSKVKNTKQIGFSSVNGRTSETYNIKDIEKQGPNRQNKIQQILEKFNIINYKIFKATLNQQAKNNTVLLTFVDLGFIEMAINLYLT